ncbi:MAG: hypothetical protein ACR652_05285 [Methylocystis sp.]|uniref:hypothetical protein n=1 Tax=Methylocystis sp. TaxID=1911079 RepID=UPI003DA37C63
MAKQDDYVRITIRIPKDLHEALVYFAGPRSLNAEIVARLGRSVREQERRMHMRDFAYGNASQDAAPGNNPQEKVAALIERIKLDAERVAILSELFSEKSDDRESGSD